MWLARTNANLSGWGSPSGGDHISANVQPWNDRARQPAVLWLDFATTKRVDAQGIDVADQLLRVALQPLRDELEAARALQCGWDGPRTKAPRAGAIDGALDFLDSLPTAVFLPDVAIGTDGEVNVNWRTDEVFVDLSFYGDDGASAYVRSGQKKTAGAGIKRFADLPALAATAVIAG